MARAEGGEQVLQASREQDRWLDTGQGYTAKGSKADMGKPCVNNLGTRADPPHPTPHHPHIDETLVFLLSICSVGLKERLLSS